MNVDVDADVDADANLDLDLYTSPSTYLYIYIYTCIYTYICTYIIMMLISMNHPIVVASIHQVDSMHKCGAQVSSSDIDAALMAFSDWKDQVGPT